MDATRYVRRQKCIEADKQAPRKPLNKNKLKELRNSLTVITGVLHTPVYTNVYCL